MVMREKRMHELAKSRLTEIKMADIFNGTVIGIIALWAVWVSTSLLIHFIK